MGNPILSTQLTADTALLAVTAGGLSPAYLGMWGGVDLIRDPYSDAQFGRPSPYRLADGVGPQGSARNSASQAGGSGLMLWGGSLGGLEVRQEGDAVRVAGRFPLR